MATIQRIEKAQETPYRTRERGHLSLVEWNPEAAPLTRHVRKTTPATRRASVDRLYEGGIILLMAASALAAIVSFVRL